MFITINKPLHLRRLADTLCFHQRTPGDVFPEACPRLPPGSPHGWLKPVCLRGNFNTSVKCVKWFFTQLSSSSYHQEWGQEACGGFLPPLPGTVIQSFDISEQKNSGTCWGFTLLLLQTATIMEFPPWTAVGMFLEKCGLTVICVKMLISSLHFYLSPDTPLCPWISKAELSENCRGVGICISVWSWYVSHRHLMLIRLFYDGSRIKGICHFFSVSN